MIYPNVDDALSIPRQDDDLAPRRAERPTRRNRARRRLARYAVRAGHGLSVVHMVLWAALITFRALAWALIQAAIEAWQDE